jgi:hypothetical protein
MTIRHNLKAWFVLVEFRKRWKLAQTQQIMCTVIVMVKQDVEQGGHNMYGL